MPFCQWKVAEVIMIPNPGKDAKFVDSYRPISLLSTLSKILEIIFLSRFPVIEERNLTSIWLSQALWDSRANSQINRRNTLCL